MHFAPARIFGTSRPGGLSLFIAVAVLGAVAAGADASRPLPVSAVAAEPRPEQEDATLHAVDLVGSRMGWAVGDHGVVWNTVDGGRSWEFQATPVDCSLRDVCFLTDQIGWAAGGEVSAAGQIPGGVVLGTTDGGKKWSVLSRGKLPYLFHLTFFGLDQGIAAGAASPAFPNGVALTQDGGKTWQPAPGPPSDGWRTAAFINVQTGTLGGRKGSFTTFGGGGVASRLTDLLGLRGLNAVDLQPDGRGWMVGDGGLILATETAGATWNEPPQNPAAGIREFFNAHAVAARGTHVWIAGSPGSAVWHSPDGGSTWQAQPLGDPAPVHALAFSSDAHGCAVGAFGRILSTDDGGQTWTAVRGGGRRAAVLALATEAERMPVRLLTKVSAEEGFRSVAVLTTRKDVGPDAHLHVDADLRLHQALTTARGNDSWIGWNLPLAAPGLDRNYERLFEEWSQLTDGRLPNVMLGSLVAELRAWRPAVVVIDEPSADQAAARLLRQAIEHAVAQAADPRSFPEQKLMHLPAWQVERVCTRMPAEQAAEIKLDPHEILPRQGRTLVMATSNAAARLGIDNPPTAEFYKIILPPPPAGAPAVRTLFGGLSLPAGGDARRMLPTITELDYDAIDHLAQHQRNFAAWRDRALDHPTHAAEVIAQLNDVLKSAPADQAGLQLAALAEAYRQRAQWQLAEEAYIELAQRYPDEPPAIDGMVWLLQMWTSQELGWRRARDVNASKLQVSVNGQVVQAVVNETQNLLKQPGGREQIREFARSSASPLSIAPTEAVVSVGGRENQREFDTRRWQKQAELIAATLQRRAPAVYARPEVQFACAALHRQRENFQRSDEIYRAFAQNSDPAWQLAARAELWTVGAAQESPKPVLQCRKADDPPVLDGLLSDACWQLASEIQLTSGSPDLESADPQFIGAARIGGSGRNAAAAREGAIAMLAYDAEYLYFAASMPRSAQLDTAPVVHAGRTHDADLRDFDRISLLLDIDRDYATYYQFEIDSRGQTREACWNDQSWNPKWYVANDADTRRWTIEAAIPLDELAPRSPVRGQFWGIGIVRTMPTLGTESWTHPAGAVPRPATFGLLRMR